MYKCNCCKKTFEEPETDERYVGEFQGMPVIHTNSYCPYCKDEDYEELIEPGLAE